MGSKSRSGAGKKRRDKRSRAGTGASTAPSTPTSPTTPTALAAEVAADTLFAEDPTAANQAEGDGAVPAGIRSAGEAERYSVDVPSAVDDHQPSTEDQLEEVYTPIGDSSGHAGSETAEDLPEDAEPGDAAEPAELEDLETILLASNLEDSMYRPPASSSFVDEMHAIEESDVAEVPSSAAHEEDDAMVPVVAESASREYVVTPGAFAPVDEPETITYIRPESPASEQLGDAGAAADGSRLSTGDVRGMDESFVHVSREADDEAVDEPHAADAETNTMPKDDSAKNAERAAAEAIDEVKAAAKDTTDQAAKAAKDTADKATKAVKDATDSINEAADGAAAKAKGILNEAKQSSERLARKALDEANEAEKALERQAKATSPAVLRTLGVLAAALAAVSGYYIRLPGRDNQRIGFAGGVASAIVGLGTLAVAFVRQSK
ncbi:hypothetical protein H4R19_004234 [Coemansia spiralis]|nr:hypothetical protein H4R19_004234 [Coemansia spiralis]